MTAWQESDKFYKHAGCEFDLLSETKMANHDQ